MERKKILIVDDEPEITSFFAYLLQRKNCEVFVANSGREVEHLLDNPASFFHAALIDLKLPDANGLDLLTRIKAKYPSCGVLIMTGYSTIKSAVIAMQRGARDYLEKPFDDIVSLEGAIDSLLDSPIQQANDQSVEAAGYGILYSPDGLMANVIRLASKLAKKAINVLIEGETGTGKELLARFLHGASKRSQSPFVAINCGAVPESLLESELFGYEKGAFTGASKSRKGFFELANHGTLFLDEIGEAPASIQVKLLRALETGEYFKVGSEQVARSDIRFISATNRDLEQEAERTRFRKDLLYRLEGVKLTLPPLRERVDDIPIIAVHHLQKKLGHETPIDPEALAYLKNYDWPGNVRQLINVLNQTIAIHDCDVVRPEHLPQALVHKGKTPEELSSVSMSVQSVVDRECIRFADSITDQICLADDFELNLLLKRIKSLETEIGRKIIEKGLIETKGDRQLLSKKLHISKRIIRYILNEK